jgi:hypothetical protein
MKEKSEYGKRRRKKFYKSLLLSFVSSPLPGSTRALGRKEEIFLTTKAASRNELLMNEMSLES